MSTLVKEFKSTLEFEHKIERWVPDAEMYGHYKSDYGSKSWNKSMFQIIDDRSQ